MRSQSLIIEKIAIKVRRQYSRVLFWKVEFHWQSVNVRACFNLSVSEVIKHFYNLFVVEIGITDCNIPRANSELVFAYNFIESLLTTLVELELEVGSEEFLSICLKILVN